MRKIVWIAFASLIVLLGCQNEKTQKLRIATAANVQFAMKSLVEAFTQETGIDCDIIVGSSGKLTAQIQAGAPYHVFVAANMLYPNTLYKKGVTTKAPEVYAYGNLVLWTLRKDIIPSIAYLDSARIQTIAIANPKVAPYGQAAIEVLKHHNLYEKLKGKLVYGESISQTNQFILSQASDIGFTATSVVLAPKIKGKGQYQLVDQSIYTPIKQGVVVIKQDEKAEQFYQFLFSEKAKTILKKFGYLVE